VRRTPQAQSVGGRVNAGTTGTGSRERIPQLAEVLRDHGSGLWRLTLAYASCHADRDDLYQEICVAIWKALPRFRGESTLRTFIYRIAHNRSVTFRLRHRRQGAREVALPDLEGLHVPAPESSAEKRVVRRERRAILLSAVAGLPNDLARPVLLRLEGLSDREIAEHIGITENNAAVRLFRARRSLRCALEHGDLCQRGA
jgi:RNA polymerase sigma factor (sigma-70 family)